MQPTVSMPHCRKTESRCTGFRVEEFIIYFAILFDGPLLLCGGFVMDDFVTFLTLLLECLPRKLMEIRY